MYTDYFGFRYRPFNLTADPQFFYSSPCSRDAYMGLWFSIRKGKQFIILTGGSGTGKTTLLHKTALQLAPHQPTLYFPHSPHTLDELLTTPGLLRTGRNSATISSPTLEELLAQSYQAGHTAVALLDEAQGLSPETFESIRHLLTLKSAHAPLLTLVLAGDESLETRLAQPEVRDLQQQIDTLIRLRRLHQEEVGSYIAYRFSAAGRERQDVFTADAIQRLAHYAKGIPRLINLFCDNALQAAQLAQLQTVSSIMIDEIAQQLLYAETQDLAAPAVFTPSQQPVPVTIRSTITPPSSPSRYPVVLKHGLDQLAWTVVGVLVAWLAIFSTTPGTSLSPLAIPPHETVSTGYIRENTTAQTPAPIASGEPTATLLAQTQELPAVQLSENTPAQEEPRMDDLAPEQEFASAAPQVIQVATPALAPRSPRRQEQSQPRLEKSSLIHRQDSQCVRAQQELAALNIAVTEASLLDAIEHGHISVVRLLLAAGVSPNARDHEGWTPLMLAARDNQQDLVQTLLDLDAHVNARNKTGGTALMMAAMNDHLLIVDTLIRHGAVIDAQTPQGWTALTYASWKGHREVVAMLLQRGADAQKKDKDGWTPLMYASWRNERHAEQDALQRDIAAALGIDGEPFVVASRGDYVGVTQVLSRAQESH